MKPVLTIPLEIKSLTDREFEGHGSVFKNVDLGGDIVIPGAFKRSLSQHQKAGSLPQMFWMHDPSRVPGKWLSMSEDKDGLAVKGVLAPTDLGNEIHTLLKMDAVRGLSIGYRTLDQDFDKDGNRLIKEAELWEVSIVSLPMNPLANVAHVKSQLSAMGEYVPTTRQFEQMLREIGCSKSVSRTLIAKLASLKEMAPEESPEDWMCTGARDLPIVRDQSWDGNAAAQSILDHAGIGTDHADAAFAKRGFLFADNDEANERGAYKEPFARVVNGVLHASSAGIAAAAQRLSSVDGPNQAQKDEAHAVIQSYEDRMNASKSRVGEESAGGKPDDSRWDAEAVELERAAKELRQSLQDGSIDREMSESKADQDEGFVEGLKTLEEELIALGVQRRWKRFAA